MHYLRSWINAELQLGLLAVVDREALHEEGGEPRPSSSTKGVEDEEALEPGALISQLPDAVQDQIHNLFA